ncbi:MAG: O-antigen ligase family protein [Candidatus Muiribacteriota bacterium]
MNSAFVVLYGALFYIFLQQKYFYSKKKYFIFLNLTAIIISIYALFQAFGYDPFFPVNPGDYYERLNSFFSTLGNKNYVGEFLFTVFLINWCIGLRNKWFNYLYILIIFLVFSRTVLVFLFLFFIFNFKKKKYFYYFLTVFICFIIIALYTGYFSQWQFQNMFTFENKNSLSQRLYIWVTTLEIIKDYFFFGVGAGHYGEAFNYFQHINLFNFEYSYFCKANFAHNEVLHIFAVFGLTGFMILIFMLFPLFKKIFYSSKYRVIFLYLIYQSMFSFPLRLPSVWVAIFPVVNLFFLKLNKRSYKKIKILTFLIIYALIINSYIIFSSVLTDYYVKRGIKAQNNEKKIEYLKKASRFNINSYEVDYNLGKIYLGMDKTSQGLFHLEKTLNYTKLPMVFYYRGLAFETHGYSQKAINDFEKFVEFFPLSYRGYFNLYMLYRDIDSQKAAHYFELFNTFKELISSEEKLFDR